MRFNVKGGASQPLCTVGNAHLYERYTLLVFSRTAGNAHLYERSSLLVSHIPHSRGGPCSPLHGCDRGRRRVSGALIDHDFGIARRSN